MQTYQKNFIDFVLEVGALKFGEFELKSGRISPYFFNAGLFNTGEHLAKLGEFYAEAMHDKNIDFDVLFGPAYKGIPLASSAAVAMFNKFGKNVHYSFNRKEAKTHGEGGSIVGSELYGGVAIIDDVITAGTAINEAMEIISSNNAKVTDVIVALDRQERGKNDVSAISEVQEKFGITVHSIISLENIITYLQSGKDSEIVDKITQYRKQYGV